MARHRQHVALDEKSKQALQALQEAASEDASTVIRRLILEAAKKLKRNAQ